MACHTGSTNGVPFQSAVPRAGIARIHSSDARNPTDDFHFCIRAEEGQGKKRNIWRRYAVTVRRMPIKRSVSRVSARQAAS